MLSRDPDHDGSRPELGAMLAAVGPGDRPDLGAQLVEWSRAALPREACGFLLGIVREGRIDVRVALCARNMADVHDAFLLDPGDVVRADRCARATGLELVGFWHSHPRAPAIPSASDARAAWPRHLHVIVSLAPHPSVRAWLPIDGRLVEVPLAPSRAV